MTNGQSPTDISNLPPGTEVEVYNPLAQYWMDGYIVERFSSKHCPVESYKIGSKTSQFPSFIARIADLGIHWRFKSFPPEQIFSKDKIWEAVVAASR